VLHPLLEEMKHVLTVGYAANKLKSPLSLENIWQAIWDTVLIDPFFDWLYPAVSCDIIWTLQYANTQLRNAMYGALTRPILQENQQFPVFSMSMTANDKSMEFGVPSSASGVWKETIACSAWWQYSWQRQ
jgi:hypothetical protein